MIIHDNSWSTTHGCWGNIFHTTTLWIFRGQHWSGPTFRLCEAQPHPDVFVAFGRSGQGAIAQIAAKKCGWNTFKCVEVGRVHSGHLRKFVEIGGFIGSRTVENMVYWTSLSKSLKLIHWTVDAPASLKNSAPRSVCRYVTMNGTWEAAEHCRASNSVLLKL